MAMMIRRLHRVIVDRIAETPWLRDRSGANAAWAHYERHAKAWNRAQTRHAAARERAQRLAAQGSERGHSHKPPRFLRHWQEAIGRLFGARRQEDPAERPGG
jgi:hypothetical protein